MEKTVLIVDDERNIVDILAFNLAKEGYRTIEAYDGPEGLRLAQTADPDIVLLDVMLPGMDGFEVLRRLRESGGITPVIMLTAREEEEDMLLGLESGADDYITKPFSMREVLARVRANVRRTGMSAPPAEKEKLRGLSIDTDSMTVSKNGEVLELSQREYELVKCMMESPNTVFTREKLLELVWNFEYYGDMRTVDVAIRRLREKLEDNPAEPVYIITKRGAGYYYNA